MNEGHQAWNVRALQTELLELHTVSTIFTSFIIRIRMQINLVSPRARRARALVSKIAIRAVILSWQSKDFGGAGEGAWEGPQGGKAGDRAGQGIRCAVVWGLSVTVRTSTSCLGQS